MNGDDACLLCGAEKHRYVSGCYCCQARLYSRIGTQHADRVMELALRKIGDTHGDAILAHVEQQIARQKR